MDSTVNVFSLPYDFLNNILFSLAYFIVRIQNICSLTLYVSVRFLFSRLLVVKILGSQKLYVDFLIAW